MNDITYTDADREAARRLLLSAPSGTTIHPGDIAAALVMAADDVRSVSDYWALVRHLPPDADITPPAGGSLARDYSGLARSLPEPGLAWTAINALLSSPAYARQLPRILDAAVPNPKQRPDESIRYLIRNAPLAQRNSITLPDIINDVLNLAQEPDYWEGVVSVAYPQLPEELEDWAHTGITMPGEYDEEINDLMASGIPRSAVPDMSRMSLIQRMETATHLWDARREAYRAVLDSYWPLEAPLTAHLTGFDEHLDNHRISQMGDRLAGTAVTPHSRQHPRWVYSQPDRTLVARLASTLASDLISGATRGWDYLTNNVWKQDIPQVANDPQTLAILKAGHVTPRTQETLRNIIDGKTDFPDDTLQRLQPEPKQTRALGR